MAKKIVLIDGHSILNRAFYGLPDMTNSEGLHTNAVYGFLNIMFRILEEEKPDYLTVAFDVKQKTFRHEMYAEYKGTRKGMPDELREQVPLIKELLQAMDICIVEKPGFEADDVLGTISKLAEKEGLEVSLVSGDRDLLQLASDKIMIRIPKTRQGRTEVENYHAAEVKEKYSVTPEHIVDLKALMGDTADNIPGVPGIGEKTAAKILTVFADIEEAHAHAEEVKPKRAGELLQQHYDLAVLSKKLATIKTDCELDYTFSAAVCKEMYTEEAYRIMSRLEFKSLLNRFDSSAKTDAPMLESYGHIQSKKELTDFLKEFYQGSSTCIGIVVAGEEDASQKSRTKKKTEQISLVPSEETGQLSLFSGEEKKGQDYAFYGIGICYAKASKEGSFHGAFCEETEELSGEEIVKELRKITDSGKIVVVNDLKRQLHFLTPRQGFVKEKEPVFQQVLSDADKVFDVNIAAYLLNPLKDTYTAQDIARDYLGMTIPSGEELFGKRGMEEIWEQEKKTFLKYTCEAACVNAGAYAALCGELENSGMRELFDTIEMPLVYQLYRMEMLGVGADRTILEEIGKILEEKIDVLQKDIYKLVGEEFNINSPKQLGVILFEKMKLPFAKKTKTGYSTSADVLEKLRSEDPVIDKILEYRQMTKLKSTYTDGLSAYIRQDGRIHGRFHQTITATGRISSTEPNLQNIPIRMEMGRELRKVFVPKEGFVFLDADYSQIELRVLAHMSGDKQLIEAYNEDQDIHRITASKVFHTPFEKVTELERRNAKAVNFGIVYGISSFGLGQDLNITRKEAEEYITKYFETYPEVKKYLDELIKTGKQEGSVRTLFGRLRPIPELKSGNFMQRSFGERVAMNSPIQGTAADIMKVAMLRVAKRLEETKLKSRIVLQIHDELLVETEISEVEQVKKILKEEMMAAADLEVKLEVDVQQGNNWFEAH